MSKRSIRKVRHRSDSVNFTFKQRVQIGQSSRQLAMGEIKIDQLPEWMLKDKLISRLALIDPNPQLTPEQLAFGQQLAAEIEAQDLHVHDEHCNHG